MFLLYFALGLLLSTALAGEVVKLDSLLEQCEFVVDGYAFNLCTMLSHGKHGSWRVRYERQAPPSVLTNYYKIMLEGHLPKNKSLADDMQCPEGTTICLTTYTRYNGEPLSKAKVLNTIPVAGALVGDDSKRFIQRGTYTPGLNIEAEMVRPWNRTTDILKVTLHGGYYVWQKQSAVIYFDCTEEKATGLRFLWSSNGDHIFSWKDHRACPQGHPEPSAPSDEPSGGEEEADEEQELVNPPMSSRSWQALWKLFAVTACIVAMVGYIVYFPPRALRRFVSRYLKNHPSLVRFRVGESVLVRWAHDEIDLDGDDPLFVEGDDINYYIEEENIPLKPSPRKGGFTSYGTA